jgi:hypothetical protein
MNLLARKFGGGQVERDGDSWRLWIPPGSAKQYRLAQIDDYAGRQRSRYPWHPSVTVSLRARISSRNLPGTWGFGLWNDPFGLSIGGGSELLRLPALPQSAWFFGASPRSYLSFRDDMPANGFFAQTLRSGPALGGLIRAALALPFSPEVSRRLISRFVQEDGEQIDLQPERWHVYRIEWDEQEASFLLDDVLVFRSQTPALAPLGLVAWIDNQFAAFRPSEWPRWGLEATEHPAWLEIEGIRISGDGLRSRSPTR